MTRRGSRASETLRLRWSDVDWDKQQLIIGADGLSKNHEARAVDFNPALPTYSLISEQEAMAQHGYCPHLECLQKMLQHGALKKLSNEHVKLLVFAASVSTIAVTTSLATLS